MDCEATLLPRPPLPPASTALKDQRLYRRWVDSATFSDEMEIPFPSVWAAFDPPEKSNRYSSENCSHTIWPLNISGSSSAVKRRRSRNEEEEGRGRKEEEINKGVEGCNYI